MFDNVAELIIPECEDANYIEFSSEKILQTNFIPTNNTKLVFKYLRLSNEVNKTFNTSITGVHFGGG